jgi:hypothetical protein
MTFVRTHTALPRTPIHGLSGTTGTNHHTQTTGTNSQAEKTSSMTLTHLVNDVGRAHPSFEPLESSNETMTLDLRCQMSGCQTVHLRHRVKDLAQQHLPIEPRTVDHLVLTATGLCPAQRSRLGISFAYEQIVELITALCILPLDGVSWLENVRRGKCL